MTSGGIELTSDTLQSIGAHFSVSFCILLATEGNQSLAVPADQYLVSASSSGDKLVVSSLKSNPVPVVELADGVSERSVLLCHCF